MRTLGLTTTPASVPRDTQDKTVSGMRTQHVIAHHVRTVDSAIAVGRENTSVAAPRDGSALTVRYVMMYAVRVRASMVAAVWGSRRAIGVSVG